MRIGHKVCVIGAGTMGSGIAAHLANLGFMVTLLDRWQAFTESQFEKARGNRPPHFYVPSTADTIRLGSIEENLAWIGEADWVCEAILEKLDAKQALFQLIEPYLKVDALISTNTSGLQLSLLTEGRSESFKKRLIGTHFFNPPRHLKLLELIPTDQTDPDVVKTATKFLEEDCARRVVVAKDTPGFITNRFGMWSMFFATHIAEKLGLSVEEVDVLTGPFIGRPRSGSFRLNDLVGLDVMQDIATNLIARCPNDPHTKWLKAPASFNYLVDKGWIGSKVGQGYYKKEGRDFVSMDLRTMAYREQQAVDLPAVKALERKPLHERLRGILEGRDEAGEFMREYLLPTLRYADYLKEEISHNVRDFDRAMMWGFGWEAGPFHMIDMIGQDKVGIKSSVFFQATAEGTEKVLQFDGKYRTPPAETEYRTIDTFPITYAAEDFTIRDMGDDITGVCFTSKMGVVTPALVGGLLTYLTQNPPKRMILTSEAKVFSVGFDLKYFLTCIQENDTNGINSALADLQKLGRLLQTIPSVAAIWGHCLGGGFELAASCSIVAASAECSIGLPESKVGLLPGGGGVVAMRQRTQSAGIKSMVDIILALTQGMVASNADEARAMGYLRPTDVTVYHPDRLLLEARKLAKTASATTQKGWAPSAGPLLGMAREALTLARDKGELTQHDHQIGDKIAHVFARATSVDNAYDLERQAFLELCREGLTLARIKHMLDNGKPLRN